MLEPKDPLELEMSDGGPAFPGERDMDTHPGMTLRQYYAAHAPAAIPMWFEVPKPPIPIRPVVPAEIAEAVRVWQMEEEDDALEAYLSEEAPKTHIDLSRKFEADLTAYFNAKSSYESDVLSSLYFAWRWYYADMMLTTGEEC